MSSLLPSSISIFFRSLAQSRMLTETNKGVLKRLQRRANQSGEVRPHFPRAESLTASETGKWFLCCPQLISTPLSQEIYHS